MVPVEGRAGYNMMVTLIVTLPHLLLNAGPFVYLYHKIQILQFTIISVFSCYDVRYSFEAIYGFFFHAFRVSQMKRKRISGVPGQTQDLQGAGFYFIQLLQMFIAPQEWAHCPEAIGYGRPYTNIKNFDGCI